MRPIPTDLTQMVHAALREWHAGEMDCEPWRDMLVVAEYLDRQLIPEPTLAVRQILLELLDGLQAQVGGSAARILRLRFLDSETAESTANQLNLTENVVYKQQRRAIDELATLLWQAESAAREEKAERILARLEIAAQVPLYGVGHKLAELNGLLAAGGPPWLVAVTGIGGIGKTSLADAAVRGLAERPLFADVAWVSARQDRFTLWDGLEEDVSVRPALTLSGLVDALVDQLGFQDLARLTVDQKRAGLRARLKARPHLVVVDNLETAADYRALVPDLPSLAGPSRFLLTSRRSLHDFPGVFGLTLDELSAADSLDLLRHEAATRGLADVAAAPSDALLPVYGAAGGNPLALKLLVGQMHTLSLAQIGHDLRQAEGRTIKDLYRHIYWRAWQMIGDDERQVLAIMPLVAESGGKLEQIATLSQLSGERLTTAVRHLVTWNLVNVRGTPVARRYSIHRLTETFLLNEVFKWQEQRDS